MRRRSKRVCFAHAVYVELERFTVQYACVKSCDRHIIIEENRASWTTWLARSRSPNIPCYNSKGSQPPKLGTSCTTLIAVSPDPLFPREGLACETREVSTLMAKSIAFLASGSDPTDVYVLIDYAALTVDALPLAGCVDSVRWQPE